MDRLTIRCGKFIDRNCDICPSKNNCHDWDDCFYAFADRLAAYEDTGCTPEQLDDFARQAAIIRIAVGCDTLEDCYKLVQEGRLIVLPCKVGDTVYWISGKAILEVYIQWFETNAYGWCACGTYPPMSTPTFRFADFGKTVFLTREEAEAALGGAENGI